MTISSICNSTSQGHITKHVAHVSVSHTVWTVQTTKSEIQLDNSLGREKISRDEDRDRMKSVTKK